MRPRPVLLIGITTVVDGNAVLGPQLGSLVEEFEVHICLDPKGIAHMEPVAGLNIHPVPMTRRVSPLADIASMTRLASVLIRVQPDITLFISPKAGLLGGLAAALLRIKPRVYWLWGAKWDGAIGWPGHLLRQSDRIACLISTDLVAVSESLAALYVSHGVSRRRRPIVLGAGGTKGVDVDRFTPSPWQAGSGQTTLGFVGRIANGKGISYLPAILDELERLSPQTVKRRFLVIGPIDEEDPVAEDVRTWLRTDSRVRCLGFDSRPERHLQALDILVFPSVREGLPNAILEAAACGVPTVAWDVTGVRDAVVDGVTGLLAEPFSIKDFAEKILAIERNSDLRFKMGEAARAFSIENFNSLAVQSAFVQYLSSLVARGTND